MSILNEHQLHVTRDKLRLIEDELQQLAARPVENAVTREWTRRSLTKRANQLKEEIAVFVARQKASTDG